MSREDVFFWYKILADSDQEQEQAEAKAWLSQLFIPTGSVFKCQL